MTDQVTVTQDDREAYIALNNMPLDQRDRIMAGEWDCMSTIQLLARHRIAGEQRGAERARQIVISEETERLVNSSCDEPDADLAWVLDIVSDCIRDEMQHIRQGEMTYHGVPLDDLAAGGSYHPGDDA